MNKILFIMMVVSLFIRCATKAVNTEPSEPKESLEPTKSMTEAMPEIPVIIKSTVHFEGMSEEEFKSKNDGLEIFDNNNDGIVYMRKGCVGCNPQYFTFIHGKLEAVTPFHAGLDKMKFK